MFKYPPLGLSGSRAHTTSRAPFRTIALMGHVRSCGTRICLAVALLGWLSAVVQGQSSSWRATAGGAWFAAENWSGAIPNSAGATANFSTRPSEKAVIELTETATLGRIRALTRADVEIYGASGLEFSSDAFPAEILIREGSNPFRITAPIGASQQLDVLTENGTFLQLGNSLPSAETATLVKRLPGELAFGGAETSGWAGTLELQDGLVTVNDTSRFGQIVIHGGELTGSGSLTTDENIELRGGAIQFDGDLTAPTIVKTGLGEAAVRGLGDNSNVVLDVREGRLNLYLVGTSDTPVQVADRYAFVISERSHNDTMILKGSTGFGNFGGILLNSSDWHGAIESKGRSIVHSSSFTEIESLRGDSFAFVSSGGSNTAFRLGTPDHTYEGTTEVGVGGFRRANLTLWKQGQLLNTSEIILNEHGLLTLNDEQGLISSPQGRIGDNIPIRMRSAEFMFLGATDVRSDERLGAIVLEQGVNLLNARGNRPILRVESLQREGSSILGTDIGTNAFINQGSQFLIDQAPQLNQFQMIGAWAVHGDEFATYDPEIGMFGLYRIVDRQPLTEISDVAHAVNEGSSTLSHDVVVASLINRGEIDLAGHTLDIASGGLISTGERSITNGKLTGGSADGNELIIHALDTAGNRRMNLAADIVDSPDGPISLIARGNFDLGGRNTYSGSTTFMSGQVRVNKATAFPPSSDLELVNSSFGIDYDASAPLQIGTFTLRGGSIRANNSSPDETLIDAEAYVVEHGYIDVHLAGNSPMVKDTYGHATILGFGDQYAGNIDVMQGVLNVDFWDAASDHSLGTGLTVVHPDAILRHLRGKSDDQALIANIELRGGELTVNEEPPDRNRWGGRIEITQDSTLAMYQESGQPYSEITMNRFQGDVILADQVTTRLVGLGTFEFSGSLQVGLGTSFLANDGRALINGVVSATATESQLDLVGDATYQLEASYNLLFDTTLTIERNGMPTPLMLSDVSQAIQGHGALVNEVIVSDGGQLSPGDDADPTGSPTLRNNLTLGPDAYYLWQFSEADADVIHVKGQLAITSTDTDPARIELENLDQSFDPTQAGRWQIISAADVTGLTPSNVVVDDASLRQNFAIPPGAVFQVDATRDTLDLVYLLLAQKGDFNENGELDVADIDALAAVMRSNSNDPAYDLNGDLLVNQEDHRIWVEELKYTYYGDSNLNGEFSPSDLILVFQAGLFEDDVPNNASWRNGDWNGDGDFTTSDLVTVFIAGGFNIGPRPAAQAVPEPTGAGLCGFMICLVGWRRRRAH